MPSIDEVRELLKQMTEEQRLQLIHLCNLENDKCKINTVYLQFKNNHHCPYCRSNKICKNGFIHNKYQQFKCNNCGKNYSIRTNTIFYYSKKNIKIWQEYIELFSQGLSLRKIVEKMDGKISYPTSFYWRHKILEVMKHFDNHDKLDGIVEADETFFEESQKGSRNMTRKPRKRGYSSYSYTQKKKVCVLTAIDRQKHSFNKPVCYGHIGTEQTLILQHRIKKDSVLITDGERSYRKLKDVKLKQLKFGKPQVKDNKIIHMNTINSFHSGLKRFMGRFNGVATKYLDNYVNYFREFRDKIDTFNQLLQLQGCYRVVDIKARKVGFESGL